MAGADVVVVGSLVVVSVLLDDDPLVSVALLDGASLVSVALVTGGAARDVLRPGTTRGAGARAGAGAATTAT